MSLPATPVSPDPPCATMTPSGAEPASKGRASRTSFSSAEMLLGLTDSRPACVSRIAAVRTASSIATSRSGLLQEERNFRVRGRPPEPAAAPGLRPRSWPAHHADDPGFPRRRRRNRRRSSSASKAAARTHRPATRSSNRRCREAHRPPRAASRRRRARDHRGRSRYRCPARWHGRGLESDGWSAWPEASSEPARWHRPAAFPIRSMRRSAPV